jgi:hypothetical protein
MLIYLTNNIGELGPCSLRNVLFIYVGIMQDFDAKKIMSGMSGYLRQELRELEILDEITLISLVG